VVYTAAYLTALGRQLLWFAGVATLIGIGEHFLPAGPNPPFRDRVGNFLIVVGVSFPLAGLLALTAFVPRTLISEGLMGVVFGRWHPASLGGLVLATAVYAFVWDSFQYWSHRMQHTIGWLWPAHALHHDDDHVNSTTAVRNTLWSGALAFVLVYLPTSVVCGFDLLTVYGAWLLFATWGFVNHANVRLRFGPLTPVISGPQWHRIHHGRDPRYHDANFAAFFPVIDVVFGTYRRPAADEFPLTGLDGRPRPPLAPGQVVRDIFGLAPRASVEAASADR
jgi:sterol desaturase/sphingolipid hydroxylase (fatty acid hydroxylase superfamily)